jgi:hypothetical protein
MFKLKTILHRTGKVVYTVVERERVGGDGVCGCSFGEPLKHETFHNSLYIYIQTSA